MTYPEELVDLAESLRKIGVSEFSYGVNGCSVRFSPGALSIPKSPEEEKFEKAEKEIPLPESLRQLLDDGLM